MCDFLCISTFLSLKMWISIICSFIFGFAVKSIINILLTPKLSIERIILRDGLTGEPYIKVTNNSKCKWNTAYELRVYYKFSKRHKVANEFIQFHSAYKKDAKLSAGKSLKYPAFIRGKNNALVYDAKNKDHKLEIVVVYSNRFGTYSVIEQECALDFSGLNQ